MKERTIPLSSWPQADELFKYFVNVSFSKIKFLYNKSLQSFFFFQLYTELITCQ